MQETPSPKVYVKVEAAFDELGRMIPQSLIWEDGTTYIIDRVTDIRQAAAMKAGGQGDRYTISVQGKQSFLFFERSSNLAGGAVKSYAQISLQSLAE